MSQELCKQCQGMMFMMSVGQCSVCKSPTSSAAYRYCSSCASKKNVCMACGKSLKSSAK